MLKVSIFDGLVVHILTKEAFAARSPLATAYLLASIASSLFNVARAKIRGSRSWLKDWEQLFSIQQSTVPLF